MTQTKVFDHAARSFDGTFTFDSIREKLHNDREWTKDDDYIGRCIQDRKNKGKIRELQNDLYEWVNTPNSVELHQEVQNLNENITLPKWRLPRNIRYYFVGSLIEKYGIPNTIKTNRLFDRSIRNFDDVLLAIVELYTYGTPFAHVEHPKISNCNQKADLMILFNWLASKIYNYFNGEPNTMNTQLNYNSFHNRLCVDFLSQFASICSKYGKPSPTFGNAQKLINMTYKYLACYSDYDDFADLFSNCHIPIDGNLLNIFESVYAVAGVTNKAYNNRSWSQLDDADYSNLITAYQTAMTGRINNHPWLAVDFYCWDGISLVLPTTGSCVQTIAAFHSYLR